MAEYGEAKCNLIIDSCCELARSSWEQPGVHMMHFTYGDGEESFVDDAYESRTAHDFYEWMRNGACPKTSQPSQMEFETAFRACIESGAPTVYLAMSSGISGCYEGAMAAYERMKVEYGDDIELYVVDTLLGSTPLSLLVAEALRLRSKGMEAIDMAEWAKEARFFINTIFMVDNLDALKRGGRVPPTVAVVGDKLDVKPLLDFDIDGRLSIMGVARGRKKGLRKMMDFFAKNHEHDTEGCVIAVGNADCPHDADKLHDLIEKEDGNAIFLDTEIGPTIGSHVGPGMISCCFWGSDRRENLSLSDRIANRVKSS